MRSRNSTTVGVIVSFVLLATPGCDKGKDAADEARPDEPAKAATPEAKVDAEPSKPEPAPEPAKPEPPAPAVGSGFVVGAARPVNNDLDGMLSIEARDSIAATTEHSLILVDPSKRGAGVIWTGLDSSLSDGGGACVSVSEHSFAVEGEELVVSKTEHVEFDAETAEEMGWSADDCKAKPKTTREVGRVGLAGT